MVKFIVFWLTIRTLFSMRFWIVLFILLATIQYMIAAALAEIDTRVKAIFVRPFVSQTQQKIINKEVLELEVGPLENTPCDK